MTAIRVEQWLDEWDKINWEKNQGRPKKHFYLFSLPAAQLRSLVGIYRRSTEHGTPRKEDLGIQRMHDRARSAEIRRYVSHGYPWSSLSDAKRRAPENETLMKPGWLPTAVVVNILEEGDQRPGGELGVGKGIKITDSDGGISSLEIPETAGGQGGISPMEVIDGQHRLFAFDDEDAMGTADYELPVVAFHGLALSLQAYLFWTINIKPKKINPSLAFDLYPILREETWLDSGDDVHVYRESRAQELTEILWSNASSPWHRRINMLGGPRKDNGPVTQAAFIRSLTATMVKPWRRWQGKPGGIFGGTPDGKVGLTWSRHQQAAFLITAWRLLETSVKDSPEDWAEKLRGECGTLDLDLQVRDAAFAGTNSLLATDQGVRGFLSIVNDFCYELHQELELAGWNVYTDSDDMNPDVIRRLEESLHGLPVHDFMTELCESLGKYDWRASSSPSLSERERLSKAALRGSGGYKELRSQLINHLLASSHPNVSATARKLKP